MHENRFGRETDAPNDQGLLARGLGCTRAADKPSALLAVWHVYVWLGALLAARPDDLRVALAMAEVEDQLLPLVAELQQDRVNDNASTQGN